MIFPEISTKFQVYFVTELCSLAQLMGFFRILPIFPGILTKQKLQYYNVIRAEMVLTALFTKPWSRQPARDVVKFWKLVAHPSQWLTKVGGPDQI